MAFMQRTHGPLSALDRAPVWLNSEPLTAAGLRGYDVLINFWTYWWRDRPARLRDHVSRSWRTRVRLHLRLIEHDDVSDEDARRFDSSDESTGRASGPPPCRPGVQVRAVSTRGASTELATIRGGETGRAYQGADAGDESGQAALPDGLDARLGLAATFATTEHVNLQTARAITVAEANGRASTYLAAVSGNLIALAFVGQMSRLGAAFYAFALILLPARDSYSREAVDLAAIPSSPPPPADAA